MTFLDFGDLIRDETVSFFVYRCCGFFARRFDQAEDLARAFVVPILSLGLAFVVPFRCSLATANGCVTLRVLLTNDVPK